MPFDFQVIKSAAWNLNIPDIDWMLLDM